MWLILTSLYVSVSVGIKHTGIICRPVLKKYVQGSWNCVCLNNIGVIITTKKASWGMVILTEGLVNKSQNIVLFVHLTKNVYFT